MDQSRTPRPWLTILGAAALLAVAVPVTAQEDSPERSSPSAEPANSIRPGWTLFVRTEPAVSIQLPAEWQEVVGEAIFTASGPAGETLELAAGSTSRDADFEAYVARLEKSLEKSRKQSIPTVFRTTSSGLVARLDQPRRKKESAGTQTSLFLYPTCEDGTRTLTITGAPPEPTPDGSLDAWDELAASVNPCTVDAVTELVLTPEVVELGARYLELMTDQYAEYLAHFSVLQEGATVPMWRKQSAVLATVQADTSELVAALPWTAETRPLGEALRAALADESQVWAGLATVRDVRDIDKRQGELGPTGAAKAAAGRAIRLALGLPTVAQ